MIRWHLELRPIFFDGRQPALLGWIAVEDGTGRELSIDCAGPNEIDYLMRNA